MPNDTTGVNYRSLINNAQGAQATRTPLTKALQYLASYLGQGMSTESTIAVAYWGGTLYVAKLGMAGLPNNFVQELQTFLESPLDDQMEEIMSVLNDGSATPIRNVVPIGGGKTGLHAEMMILAHLPGIQAWNPTTMHPGVYVAASQGACPGCAGFMNFRQVAHTGVRANGKVSSRWINPVDDMVCGSEVGLGLSFPNVALGDNYKWVMNW